MRPGGDRRGVQETRDPTRALGQAYVRRCVTHQHESRAGAAATGVAGASRRRGGSRGLRAPAGRVGASSPHQKRLKQSLSRPARVSGRSSVWQGRACARCRMADGNYRRFPATAWGQALCGTTPTGQRRLGRHCPATIRAVRSRNQGSITEEGCAGTDLIDGIDLGAADQQVVSPTRSRGPTGWRKLPPQRERDDSDRGLGAIKHANRRPGMR